jgi:hypothetical protein
VLVLALSGMGNTGGGQAVAERGRQRSRSLKEDAVQHLLMAATTGPARFSGETDQQARIWCEHVLHNFVVTELRRSGREQRPSGGYDRCGVPPSSGCYRRVGGQLQALCDSEPAHSIDFGSALSDFCRLVEREIDATHRSNDARTLCRSFRLWVDHLVGPRGEADVSSQPRERAANAMRQRRRRGRAIAASAVRTLTAQGELTEQAEAVARCFGLSPPYSRTAAGARTAG